MYLIQNIFTNLIKKYFIFFLTWFFVYIPNYSNATDCEHRFGIKISPSSSFCNTEGKDCCSYSALGFNAGMIYDFVFKNNHAISTGIAYFTKGFNIKSKNENHKFHVSYANIPALLKLHSNEFWLDTQIFLFSGLILGIKIVEDTPPTLHSKQNLF